MTDEEKVRLGDAAKELRDNELYKLCMDHIYTSLHAQIDNVNIDSVTGERDVLNFTRQIKAIKAIDNKLNALAQSSKLIKIQLGELEEDER